MHKISKIIYNLKNLFFLCHFYFIFMLLPNIIQTGIIGYLFLIIYFVYIIKIIYEMMHKFKQQDKIYNLMQIGMLLYIIIFSLKISLDDIYVTGTTLEYLIVNYVVIGLLIIFILLYAFLDGKKRK